jgi:hypothetical protein
VGFEASGALWLSATNLQGRRFGLARTRYLDDDPRKKPRWQTLAMTVDDLRWYSRPTPLGNSTTDEDRKTFTLAVTIRELHPEIWLAEGI